MYALALRRRLALALRGDFDPYPPPPPDSNLSPFAEHRLAYREAPLALSWAKTGGEPKAWQTRLRDKLITLSGYRRTEGPPAVLLRDTAPRPAPNLNRERLYLRAWPEADIPLDFVWSDDLQTPAPLMICLQGTNAGAHLSWGEARMPPDPIKIAAGLDFARQAAAHGYVALCLEQKAFGERRERLLQPRSADPCIDAALHSFLLGRSLLGDRVSDVSAVLDWLTDDTVDSMPAIDPSRIHIMGHSAGGSVALHAAAFDTRIGATIASGSVGPIRETFANRRNSSGQNTIPGQLLWCELGDVIGLVAPRPLLVTSGDADHIFPFAGAERSAVEGQEVYAALDSANRLRTLCLSGGHRFDPQAVWPVFTDLLSDA